MPLFESQESKDNRIFKGVLPEVFGAINATVTDKPTCDIFLACAAGSNQLAKTLATKSPYLKKLWGKGSQDKAFALNKILMPAMLSRFYWGIAEFPSPEARNIEYEERLSPLLELIFNVSAEKNENFRTRFSNLHIQFNYECDWLQGKVTASESDESNFVWNVFQYADEFQLNEEQRQMISGYFDVQYSLLTSLARHRVTSHSGTPIFFEFMLWIDICSQVVFAGKPLINWSTQKFPIEGQKQLIPALGSPIPQLQISNDWPAWLGGIAGGQEFMRMYYSSL